MRLVRVISAAAILGASVTTAQAASVGFEMDGHLKKRNFAMFSLTNTSSDASIVGMSMTIGDTRYNFDRVRAGSGASIVTGDARNNKERFDDIALAFDQFAAGDSTTFRLDLDRDSKKKRNKADYSKVLFNNGAAENSAVTVTFSNGEVLTAILDDQGSFRRMARSLSGGDSPFTNLVAESRVLQELPTEPPQNGDLSAVPLPAALPLMLGGLFGMGLVARRRKG